jgi:hypothetical protein
MSQIDIMPTVMGLLHFSYASEFVGQNVFDSSYRPRAFVATYQDMGYIRDSMLTVLSPVRQVKQYRLELQPEKHISNPFQYKYKEIPVKQVDTVLKNEAISYYQSAALITKSGNR